MHRRFSQRWVEEGFTGATLRPVEYRGSTTDWDELSILESVDAHLPATFSYNGKCLVCGKFKGAISLDPAKELRIPTEVIPNRDIFWVHRNMTSEKTHSKVISQRVFRWLKEQTTGRFWVQPVHLDVH
jgi:hypothetical protein